jgi:AcrR family transcriptional regulator
MRAEKENKARVETAAIRLFAEKGVAGASVAEIASAAGVSQGYLYRHWKDKDEMAFDLFARLYLTLRDRFQAAAEAEPTTHGRIAAMIREGCRVHDENPAGFRFLLTTQHQHLGRLPSGTRTMVDVVKGIIAEGIAKGEIGLTDEVAATVVVFGTFLQAATFDLYGDLGRSLGDAAEVLAAACWRAVAGRSAT